MYIADLHIHSRFSRATSKDCDAPHLDFWARRKGISLIGAGDFTHPAWRAELKEQLVSAGEGVYVLRDDLRLKDHTSGEPTRFIITGEISSIYKRGGKTRKVHNLILLPSLEKADELSAKLEAIGNIRSDGRPILGLDSRDLLELTLDTCPDAEFIPAHIWTPHFSMFGAFSAFSNLEECFGDMAPYIHAFETGLSSDPPMNWRVPALDGLTLISNSDAHSPSKLGREANLLDTAPSYPGLVNALRTGEGVLGTVEFFPEEGKYHLDGHRNCGICLTPAETLALGGLCPVCGRKLTIGVEHRVEEMAARPSGYKPDSAKPFESLAPLPEVIAASTGKSESCKAVLEQYEQMLGALGPEFYILRDAPIKDIERTAGPCVAEGIRRLRSGQVERKAGFDGEYGVISLLSPSEIDALNGQLFMFGNEKSNKSPRSPKLQKVPAAAAIETANPTGDLFNPQQQAAVTAPQQTVAVIAGPGTGKTKTLVARIAYLVEELKVKPEEITAVTFTNQAAGEMRQRLEKRLGGKKAISRMTIGTFHSICLKLLGNVNLISPGEALTLAGDVLRSKGIKKNAKDLLQAISAVKNGTSLKKADLAEEIYEEYCSQLRRLNVLDFDDLLTEALKLDSTGNKAFSYLLVDEFQDINDVQYSLIQAWSKCGKSLFVIGDPDQSIYGFRGVTGNCFQRLTEDFTGVEEIRLAENYRSTPEILRASLSVISKNPGTVRELLPNRPSGFAVRLVQAQDDFAEGIFIAKEISRMTGGIDMLEAHKSSRYHDFRAFSDIAVLCRTHRQLELIEKCLRHDDIPCVISGKEDFMDTDEVRGLLAFLRSLQEPGDIVALGNALTLLWDCPADLVQMVQKLCENQKVFDIASLRSTLNGYQHLEYWLDRAEEWLPLVRKEKPRKLVEHWEELYGGSQALQMLKNTAVFYPSLQELWNALLLGQEPDIRRASGDSRDSGSVHLMTLHASKGLEFPAVFVAGIKTGMLPLESQTRPADTAEERRLLFVGMTRAREELILTAAPEPSAFLSDLPSTVERENTTRRIRNSEQLSML